MSPASTACSVTLAGMILLVACNDSTSEPPRVASVEVTPAAAGVAVDHTVQLTATVRDAGGNALANRPVTWTSDKPAVATVSATGLVTGRAVYNVGATISATSEGVSGTATVTVMAPTPPASYASVEAGLYHSCGRTPAGAAYCWGWNGVGELGDGTATSAPAPVAVTGGLSFALVSVGGPSSCGLTAAGAAYCWGTDIVGALGAGTPGPELCTSGEGTYPCSHHPVAVAGGLAFTTLSAGWLVVCGLDPSGAAHCWGENTFGALGVGSNTATLDRCYLDLPCSRTPLAVKGGLRFTAVGAGLSHACGLTGSGAAYCWGSNTYGQLGIGTLSAPDSCDASLVGGDPLSPCSRTPVPVTGGLTFTRLSVGRLYYSCGLATDGNWYCWGLNNHGQLGNGTTGPETCQSPPNDRPCSSRPVAVAGGLNFATVSPGSVHGCGVTSAGVAYCWGVNDYGQLGDGTMTRTLTPVAVAGRLSFSGVSPYAYHTCGLTLAGVAYCWGRNTWGNLGHGTWSDSSVPVQVAGQFGAMAAAVITRNVERGRRSLPSLRPPLP